MILKATNKKGFWASYKNLLLNFVIWGAIIGGVIGLIGGLYSEFFSPKPIAEKHVYYINKKEKIEHVYLFGSKSSAIKAVEIYNKNKTFGDIVSSAHTPTIISPSEKIYILKYRSDLKIAKVKRIRRKNSEYENFETGWVPIVTIHDSIDFDKLYK